MLLPYTCQVERGRIALQPASERAYKIIGPRASHAFTACQPGRPDQCRTWQLHKFDLACGTVRVSWLAVVAAGLERSPGRGRVEGGRLSLRMGPVWRGTGAVMPTVSFPPGFAPAVGLGARFLSSAAPPTVVDARQAVATKANKPADTKSGDTKLGDAGMVARSESHAPAAPLIVDGWQATVETAVAPPWRLSLWRALGGLGLVLAAWGALIFTRRRVPVVVSPVSASAEASSTATADTDDAALCAELIARSVNLHRAAKDALASVPSDSLRQILADDLAAVQRILLAPALTTDVADNRWHAVKPIVTAALADIERVARIIAGVLSSAPSLTRDAPALPQSAAEAFEVLGINPEASRTVIKKVVDGLRQSWHPDHARNDNDRAAREERLKQINVAWDLIRRDRPPEHSAA